MFHNNAPGIHGHISRGYEPVREAFTANFAERRELGGACCAFVHGENVVDLWGGVRNKQTGERWEQDTMVVVHSATKGLAAMTLAIAHSRGWLDYEERVSMFGFRSQIHPIGHYHHYLGRGGGGVNGMQRTPPELPLP
jgi:hypothetical protein